jgi:hypothetical protein
LTLTYLYCLVRSRRRPALRRLPQGLPGAGPVRELDAVGGLWLIVSDVASADYGEEAIARGLKRLDWVTRRAMGHEAVVEHFLGAPAVLPMQLFTIFTSDDRALDYVNRARRRITSILSRINGQLEWGLRLTWDEHTARAAVERKHAEPAARGRVPSGDGVSGMAYLARKRDLLDVNRVQLASARAHATRLFRAMSKCATDARRRTATERAAPGSRLLLDSAYLVPASQSSAFRAALRRQTRRLIAPGMVVSLTGPWPPYNFVNPPPRAARRRVALGR